MYKKLSSNNSTFTPGFRGHMPDAYRESQMRCGKTEIEVSCCTINRDEAGRDDLKLRKEWKNLKESVILVPREVMREGTRKPRNPQRLLRAPVAQVDRARDS